MPTIDRTMPAGTIVPLPDDAKKDEPKQDDADKPDEASIIAAVKLALGEKVSDV